MFSLISSPTFTSNINAGLVYIVLMLSPLVSIYILAILRAKELIQQFCDEQ
jgi:hypothetical protein